MKFELLNVEHGFAAYVIADDGTALLFDCGRSGICQPSEVLRRQGIRTVRRLFITNYDEDHIADLQNVRQNFDVRILTRNPSLNAQQLRNLKQPHITPAMACLLEMIETYTNAVPDGELLLESVHAEFFYNSYPEFNETNDLSLLIFLQIMGRRFVLSGDLERRGWLALLDNGRVRELLSLTDVFVASHHGRESGYCREVFDHCRPSLIVMSDGPIKYNTQTMAGAYAEHASGEWFTVNGERQWRKVVTTRKDGNISWRW